MRCPALALLALILNILSVTLFAQASDEAAIRAVVQKYVEAREARDAKAIEPLFTADADQLVSDGTWRRGRDDLVRGMLESTWWNPVKRAARTARCGRRSR